MPERLTPKSVRLETPAGSLSLILYVAPGFTGLHCVASLRTLQWSVGS
jgi:hypothetical protein